eukprot:g2866.t1
MRRLRSVFFAQAVLAVLLFVAALSRFCYLRLPRGFSHFIPAPAATADEPRIRFATYNILSPTLAGGLGAGEAYRDPEYRLAKIKQKLLRECKQKSILGLQEVGLSWKGPLTAFFEAHNYRVVDTHYGSQGTDYMGTMLAYPAELYQAVDLKVERTADMQQAPNREPALPYAERKAKEKREREAREAAKAARIAAGRKQSATEVAWEIASGAPNRVILAKLRVIVIPASAGDSSSSPGAGEDTTFVVGVCHNPAWFGSEEKEMGLLLHTTFWMQGLQEFAGPLPHVMLGDMNFAPSSPPHQWVTRTLPIDEPSRPWPWIWLLEEDTGKGMVGESETSSGGKNGKGDRKQSKKRTADVMEVEDEDPVEVVDATMAGQTQTTQDGVEMVSSTQGSTSTAATEQLPQMGEELKWSVLLNVAEKVKLGLEKNAFSPDKVEDIAESMIKNTTGKQQRFLITDRERSCMTTCAIMIVMTLEMEEHSRCMLKVEENDRRDEKNSAAALEGIVSEFRFVVHQRMQGNAMWRAAIHEHCKAKWLDDRRSVLEASNPDFEVELDVVDIGTEFFREARRTRPEEGKGLFDSELHDHARKYADKIIDECKDTEVLNDLHWKPVAKRLLQYLLVSENSIVDARICFGSLVAVEIKKIDLKSPELKNRTNALYKVPKKEARPIFNFLMIGELELGFAESSWRRVNHETSEDDVRSGAPVRGKEKVDDDTATAVADGFWDDGNKEGEKSTVLAIRGSNANTGVGTSAIVPHGKRSKANVIADLERWHKMSAIEKLQACRDTPLDEILLPDPKAGFFVLMKGYFLLEVEEVAKTVIIFRMYEVLDLSDSLALRVRSQRDSRITGLIRKVPLDLEKGDFVAALVDWQNHYKTGKAELRVTGEDHTFVVREPWNFLVHSETEGLPPRIADVEPSQTGTELVKFDEKSIFAKVQGMIEENNRQLRSEIDEGNKKSIEKMENMLTSSITPLQEKMATVVKSSEDTKDELQGIRQRMKKEEKKRKKGQKRSESMLITLLKANKLEVPDDEESESSEESSDDDNKKKKPSEQEQERGAGQAKGDCGFTGGGRAIEDKKPGQRFAYGEDGWLEEKKEGKNVAREQAVEGGGGGSGVLDGGGINAADCGLIGSGATSPPSIGAEGKVKDEVARIEEQATTKRLSVGSIIKPGLSGGSIGGELGPSGVGPAVADSSPEDLEMPAEDEKDEKPGHESGEMKHVASSAPPKAASTYAGSTNANVGSDVHAPAVNSSGTHLLATSKPPGAKQGNNYKKKGGKSAYDGGARGAPGGAAQENGKKKKKTREDEEDDESDEGPAEPPKKRRKAENLFVNTPIDEVEPLPGHRQLRVTNVNMMGTEVHNERLSWIADVAGWRKLDAALLSEFAYLKKRRKAAAKKKFARRLRKSERDEESSDDEANDEGGAVEFEDPIAARGEPTWVLRKRFDLLYINGCGVMLFNKRLREQAKRIREQQLKHAVRSQTRFLALYLSEVVIAATYAPTANASDIELETYDSTAVSMMQEMQKRRRDKWKLRIVGGDISAHVGRDEFADSVVHLGVGGARATNARGRTFAKTLMATNTALVSSKFEIESDGGKDDAYHTFKGRADGVGSSEVDHFLSYGPHLSKFRAYRRVDYGAPDENGVSQARVGVFDHLAVEVLVDVRTRRRLEEEGEIRAIAAREVLEEVDPEVQQRFSEDLRRRVRVAGGDFHLEDFQDFLVEWLDSLSGKRSQQSVPDEVDPDELEDNGRARSNMWKLFRDQKLNERPSSGGKGGITPKQAKKKYDEVGNSPLFPGEDELPASKDVQELVQAFPADIMEKIEKPVSASELKRAAQHLKSGGKAKDINGLGAAILLKLDGQSLELMTEVVQKELSTRDFHTLGGGLHTCRDVSLYKGKGERSDPDSYRFLVISPLITKLLVRIMSERLYDALEQVGFFQDSQFGFRRKRGTQDSMLVMNRIREDLRHYRFHSALRIMVILVDLRKAFPSLDWRLVTGVVEGLGIRKTKLWEVLDATHRSSTHSFGEGSFSLEHGCKEGDPSSPLLFIMAFTVVMKRLKQKLEERRIARGEVVPDGVPLFVREDARHLAREDKIVQLGMGSNPSRTVDYVLDFLFADDTTLVQRLREEQVRRVKEHDEEAKRRGTPLFELPIMEVFGQTLTDCGLRENESKRVQSDVVEIVTRNLGMNVDPEADCAEKIKKAWKAEATRIQKEENKILGQILDCRWWEREMRGWTYADLRRRAKVPAFKIHLKYLQARYFAHVMRMPRDRITWKAMAGKFIPPLLQPVGAGEFDPAIDWLRSDANVAELGPAAREMPDMLGDRISHLANECGMPIEMLRLLLETVDEANARRPELRKGELYATNKSAFYAATRKWFIREVARDWARGDPQAEERAADALTEKYFGDKSNPKETREQMRKRAVAMGAEITPDEAVRRHYRPSASGLEGVFYSGRCKWCGVQYGPAEQEEIWCEPTEIATVPPSMKEHLGACHQVFKPDAEEVRCRQEFVKLAKARDAERGKQIRAQIIGKHACLSEVRTTGPRRAGRVTHVPKIACRFCKHKNKKSAHFTNAQDVRAALCYQGRDPLHHVPLLQEISCGIRRESARPVEAGESGFMDAEA